MKRLILPALLALGACSLLPERPPAAALHDFGGIATRSAAWGSVSVDAPDWLQTENIRYRLLYADPTQVRFYTLDRWLAPPPALFAQRLSLKNGGRYGLKIRLLEFEQVFDAPQHASMGLGFHAVAYRPGEDNAAAEKTFRLARPTASADAKGAVAAAARLADEAADALNAWLETLESPKPQQ